MGVGEVSFLLGYPPGGFCFSPPQRSCIQVMELVVVALHFFEPSRLCRSFEEV